MKSKTVGVSIAVSPENVYAFASNPANLTEWAPAFCKSVALIDDKWVIQSPDGPMTIRFAETNPFGVLDHVVKLPSGQEINNPMRVIPNGTGSEVLFTLFQRAGMTEEQFAEDARLVESDLQTLKRVLEASG